MAPSPCQARRGPQVLTVPLGSGFSQRAPQIAAREVHQTRPAPARVETPLWLDTESRVGNPVFSVCERPRSLVSFPVVRA